MTTTMIQTKHRSDLDTDKDFCIEVIYPDGTTLLINVPKSNPELIGDTVVVTQPPTQPYGLNMVFGGHYE
jgi:hypothetical protein